MEDLFNICSVDQCSRLSMMDKDMHSIFFSCPFYNIWAYRNQDLQGEKKEINFFIEKINDSVEEFAVELNRVDVIGVPMVDPDNGEVARWIIPASGFWEVNVDASFKNGCSALAAVFWDENGLLVFLASKLTSSKSLGRTSSFALGYGISRGSLLE